MFSIIDEPLSGVLHVSLPQTRDQRGVFVKNWHPEFLTLLGREFVVREEFYSFSARGVLRGMHFQTPPHAHDKLVSCLAGEALDVVVDLRCKSGTYGCAAAIQLRGDSPSAVFIPAGFAHGFLSLSAETLMSYKTSVIYHAESDRGLAWDSIDFKWPIENPILSSRDSLHPPLSEFKSPF